MCENMHVNVCNVDANSLNVASRTFPHFSHSMLTQDIFTEELNVFSNKGGINKINETIICVIAVLLPKSATGITMLMLNILCFVFLKYFHKIKTNYMKRYLFQ